MGQEVPFFDSGIEMFKRRNVAIRQPPRSLGITTCCRPFCNCKSSTLHLPLLKTALICLNHLDQAGIPTIHDTVND